MRIAIIHNMPSGGALRSTANLLRHLGERHEITCFSLSCSADSGQALAGLCRESHVTPFRLLAFTLPSRLQPFGWLLDLRRMAFAHRQIAATIDSSGFDVVLTNTCPFFEMPAVLRFVRTPSVYHSQAGTYPAAANSARAERQCGWKPRLNPGAILFSRALKRHKNDSIRAAGAVVANSHFSREELYRDFGVNAFVSYPGVDTTDFYIEPHRTKRHAVLGVGALAPFKAHDFSIAALAQIPETLRPELWIAHHTEVPGEKDYLLSLAQKSGVRLTLTANAATEQLRDLYNSALATVFPSIFEPLGLVPLESMACGTPSVGVAEGGIRETIIDGETGFLTQRDPKAFAFAITRLAEEPGLAESMGRSGREYVLSKWDPAKAAASFEAILLEVAR